MTILPAALVRQKAPLRLVPASLAWAFRGRFRRPGTATTDRSATPAPVETRVCYTPDLRWTTIFRRWRPGDSGPAGKCRRCLKCYAYDGGCLMTIPRIVDRAEAATFSPLAHGVLTEVIRP